MLFGAFSLSAVKLVLGLPWDLEILDNVMAVRGDVQVNNSIPTRQGCILVSMTLVNVTRQSRHDYVANG